MLPTDFAFAEAAEQRSELSPGRVREPWVKRVLILSRGAATDHDDSIFHLHLELRGIPLAEPDPEFRVRLSSSLTPLRGSQESCGA